MVDEKQRFMASLAKSWQLLTMSQIVEILAEQGANKGPTVEQALIDLECATRDKIEQMQKLQDQVFRDHAKGFDLDALPEAGVTRELSCVACGKRTDVEDFDPRDTYYCEHCKGLLVPLSGPTSELDETSRALPEIDAVPDPSSSGYSSLDVLDATGEVVIATEDDDLDDPELKRYDELITIQIAGGGAPPAAGTTRSQTQRVPTPFTRPEKTSPVFAPPKAPTPPPATPPAGGGPKAAPPVAMASGPSATSAPISPAPAGPAIAPGPSKVPAPPPIPSRRQSKAPMIVGLDDEPFSRKSSSAPPAPVAPGSSAKAPAPSPAAPSVPGGASASTGPKVPPPRAATTCCGHSLDAAWRFCPRCARPALPCAKCARALEREWRTCPYCATTVAP